ncbi:major capsid protein [Streptomyces sp. A13(2022)]|uniref:major capsid protein n=1 Tax=Streptomyces sp. A13(2022) TaxID=2964768 RepID=UPI0021DB5155|nr:major capsid protein [Streptomyces sp. A13(2022)]MCU8589928.1 major capsid protein [Streptomyces sp. A13(2022)]
MAWVLDTEYIEPEELTAVVRQSLAEQQINRFTLSRYLPNVAIDDITFKFSKGGTGGLAEASVYRAWDTESRIGRREGVAEVMGELPPISEKIPLNEYDSLRIRNMETTDPMRRAIARDGYRIATNIAARFELGKGEALANAQFTINENNLALAPVQFGRKAEHSVTAAVLWSSHATAKPLDDLEAWVQVYVDTNGSQPDRMIMPRTVLAHMRQCDQVVRQVYPLAPSGSSPMVSVEQLNTVLSSLDLPAIELNDARVSVDGTPTRVMPSDALVFVPAPGAEDASQPTDLGGFLLGTTAESLEPEYSSVAERAGVVAATWKTKDPVRLWTHAAAVGMPVVREPNLTFKAKVI